MIVRVTGTMTKNVLLIGGSGFVGRHVAHELSARGLRVRIPTRSREKAKPTLLVLPTADVVDADVHDEAQLRSLMEGMDAVVNLVGILHEHRAGQDFQRTHVELPRKVIAAAKASGITRLLHMSALHADTGGPSAYLRSKGEAEKLVRESGLHWTIFRPSVVFGRDDSFLNLFAGLAKTLPVLALACPNARFQPVYVEDVARAMAASLDNEHTFGQSYDLGGPRVYTLRELVDYVCGLVGRKPAVIGLGDGLSYFQAWVMEWLPGKLMTRDNYFSMKVDSVCGGGFPSAFGFQPTPMEAVVPGWLAQRTPRARYDLFRCRAGR